MSFFLNILSIFLLMSAGWVLRRRKLVDDVFTLRLSFVLINVFYPCLLLNAILSRFTLETLLANWPMPVGLFLIKLTGWLIGAGYLKFFGGRMSPSAAANGDVRPPLDATRRTFHFVCSVNNYSFLPIMLAKPLWGDDAVALIAFGVLGAEIFVWTLGIRTLSGHTDLRHLLSTPMVALFIAFSLLLLHYLLPFEALPEPFIASGNMLLSTCRMAGEATIPVSAFICGARIGGINIHHNLTPPAWIFTALRLALIPAVCVAIIWFLPLDGLVRTVLMLIAVQPAAMASVSMSEVYRGDPDFAATAVFLSHILCLATIPLWMMFLLQS